jgi:hypothetical protein
MTGRPGVGKARARGNIETLRSGALRVRVYAGLAPVTKKRHNLIEVVPPGPKAMRKAEAIRDRLLHEVAEKRNPRTSATVDQLLDRNLEQFDGAPNTLTLRPVVDAVSYLARAAGDWLVLWTFHHRGLVEALGARGGCGTDEDGGWRSWDTFCGRGAISFQEGSGPRRSGCRCGRCCSARPPVSL